MKERIERKNDENLYQPKIHSDRIRSLYQLKQAMGKPMTVLVDQAIHEFAASYNVEHQDELEEKPREVENWEELCEYRTLLDRLDYLRFLAELEKIEEHEQRGSTDQ